MTDVLAAFARGQRVAGEGWTARCPAHDDARNSLSIGRGDDGRWLVKCHAGCALDAVLAAAHLELADLFAPKASTSSDLVKRVGQTGRGGRIVATYDYLDEIGAFLYQSFRREPKDFGVRRPNGAGDWIWNLKGVRRVVYRLPDLKGRRTVFACEGEKDADRLWTLGLPATTNAGGAGKWRNEYSTMLQTAGCQQVIVLPDNDPTGAAHGRDVARSCVDAGLAVKVIALPGLPEKGDVSDYLQQHSKDDLLALVKDAPLFTPHRRVAAAQRMQLTTLADLLDEPDDQYEWVVESRIPARSIVLLAAPPKAGKSTLARELACAVSRGEPWLGWPTTAGAVWLFLFEDKRSEVKKHFRRMGADGAAPVRFFIGQAPTDLLPQLHDLADKEHPALIVVDTLARALKVKDFNDYAEVTNRFEPLLNLTRATGATLLLLHHGSAHQAREGLDAVLGSTALSGSVDNILILKRTDQQRVLSSVQRIGPDLEPTLIVLNGTTGRLERAGRKCDVDDAELGDRLVAALRTSEEPVTEPWLQEQVGGRKTDEVRILRKLIGVGVVRRVSGAGRKGDPWRYGLVEKFGSHDLAIRENLKNTSEPQEPNFSPKNTGLFDASENSVPQFPPYSREQHSTYVGRTSSTLDPSTQCDSVPVVPDHSGNSRNGTPGTANAPDKHCSEFGSRTCDSGQDDEPF